MPQVRGKTFGELQYMALNLIESTIEKIDWKEFLPAIELFADREDAKTVLQLLDKAVIVVGFDTGDDEPADEPE